MLQLRLGVIAVEEETAIAAAFIISLLFAIFCPVPNKTGNLCLLEPFVDDGGEEIVLFKKFSSTNCLLC